MMLRSSIVLTALLGLFSCAAFGESTEADLLAEVLDLRPGARVADVGAGDGEWSLEIASRVGRSGHVFATEVTDDDLDEIRWQVEDSDARNVTVIEGRERDSGLPEGCCDAILLRLVYHHFTHPEDMMADLARSLVPGGRLVIVDIVPQTQWRDLEGVPERGGHGIRAEDLERELGRLGWTQIDRRAPWAGDEDKFAAVFVRQRASGRRPSSADR